MASSHERKLQSRVPQLASQGKWRELADLYRQLYNMSMPTSPYHYWYISGYCNLFQYEEIRTATDSDLEFMEGIVAGTTAPNAERVVTGLGLGFYYWSTHQREKSVKTYRRALKIEIQDVDRKRKVLDGLSQLVTAASEMEKQLKVIRDNLGSLGSGAVNETYRPTTTRCAGGLPMGPLSTNLTPQIRERYLDASIVVPGARCGTCGVLRETKKLSMCQKCNKKYYCSKECQAKDWRDGRHKHSCREPNDVQVGDVVRLQGLTSTEYNGNIVEVVGTSINSERLAVRIFGGDKTVSAKIENMSVIMPKELREDTNEYHIQGCPCTLCKK